MRLHRPVARIAAGIMALSGLCLLDSLGTKYQLDLLRSGPTSWAVIGTVMTPNGLSGSVSGGAVLDGDGLAEVSVMTTTFPRRTFLGTAHDGFLSAWLRLEPPAYTTGSGSARIPPYGWPMSLVVESCQ